MQRITLLGATGSIGDSTLDVIAKHRDKYSVFALTGNRRLDKLASQCCQHSAQYAVVNDEVSAKKLRALISERNGITEVLHGQKALSEVAASPEVDIVMAAIVGAAGLMPTLSAVEANKKVLLANKESLVMAGSIFMQALNSSKAILLPIDSEHNAIFQCLPSDHHAKAKSTVKKLILSASGGPFRGWSFEEMQSATPEQACAHPNWSMGDKISVDSASMMNKGLEVIEARWLFDTPVDRIDVLVHPQSIIHSLVQYVDGSTLAQLGNPDMKIPIAHALAWPDRIDSTVADLDLIEIATLDFEAPDRNRFPCLQLAYDAASVGGDAPTVLNAANEIAVAAFLKDKIGFLNMSDLVADCMEKITFVANPDLEDYIATNNATRVLANELL